MVILLLVVLFVCIALGIPIAISIGLSSLVYLLAADLPIVLVAQRSILGGLIPIHSLHFLSLYFQEC